LTSVIGLVTLSAKPIVQPSQASRMACRNEPGPLSLLVVTTGFWAQTAALATGERLPDSDTRMIADKMSNGTPILK
jgi:hypothetical protein